MYARAAWAVPHGNKVRCHACQTLQHRCAMCTKSQQIGSLDPVLFSTFPDNTYWT